MPTYRARPCPNCSYYVGFTVGRRGSSSEKFPVNGVCLNCGYRLPMQALVVGRKRRARRIGGVSLRAVGKPSRREKTDPESQPDPEPAIPAGHRDYAVDLRAIGQELEAMRVARFNLECSGVCYTVWPQETKSPADEAAPKDNPLRALWKRIRSGMDAGAPGAGSPPPKAPQRFGGSDIDRIDRAGKARRQPGGTITDGHALSQLMRTLGTLIVQRRQRLLAVSWQPLSIGVVVETPAGKRQLDLYRHDQIYDFWVKCYLRRAGRAYSDVPT
ncbi:MAG TPA: hypothetical protein VNO43_12940 [Candidatus Eisenbacteria bacterium]|nr:hypothetical protein [Candidatus Eisenbacteria bacterium]